MMEQSNFYKDKRAIVTGGAGMVGSALVPMLLDRGAAVTVLDNFSRGKTRIDGAEYVYGDAGDEGTCRDVIKGADIVFNLAAEVAGVQFNQSHHAFMFYRNLRLLVTPLRIAAEYGIDRFLQTSSVCIYPEDHNHPAVEDNGFNGMPTAANLGYSMAKRMGEMCAQWYAQESGLHAVIVRPSNVFGPHDYFDERAHVIPALIKKCLDDETIIVNGTGEEIREFIYVDDVARGMMAAIERGKSEGVYNIGTNGETKVSIRDLLARLLNLTNRIYKPVQFGELFSGGDNRRWSDCRKARDELKWTYEVSLNDGLRSIVEWYLAERLRDEQEAR